MSRHTVSVSPVLGCLARANTIPTPTAAGDVGAPVMAVTGLLLGV